MSDPQAEQNRPLDPNNAIDALQLLLNGASIPKLDMRENTVLRLAHLTLQKIVNEKETDETPSITTLDEEN